MNHTQYQAGAFVFARARGCEPRNSDDIKLLAEKYAIEESLIPSYSGDRTTIGRAITQATAGLTRQGYLVRPIKRSSKEVIYGIVREKKDEVGQRLDHDFEATVTWQKEPDPSIVQGDHAVAVQIADHYRQLRGKITASDWSSSISAFLDAHDATPIRSDGRVFWVPPQRIKSVLHFSSFLQEVGIDLILCELQAEQRQLVHDIAHQSLEDQLDKLELEIESFDGTQKPSTYQRRLDEYQRLRNRAGLYQEALGVGVDRAKSVLANLEIKVQEMLEVRTQVVIPRKPKETQEAVASVAIADEISSLIFGGAEFLFLIEDEASGIVTFVSDETAAKQKVAQLKTMNLEGKWQQIGRSRVCIQNGCPSGSVSIRLDLPDDPSIAVVAKSLATIGIEIGYRAALAA